MRMIGWVVGFAVVFSASFASGDTLIFKSGQRVRGKIEEKSADLVKVTVEGVSMSYPAADIAQIISEPGPLPGGPVITGSVNFPAVSKVLNTDIRAVSVQDCQAVVDELKQKPPLSAETAGLYFTLGYSYYRMGNFKKALEVFQDLVKLDPNDSRPRAMLGLTYKALGNLDAAEHHLQAFASMLLSEAKTRDDAREAWLLQKIVE